MRGWWEGDGSVMWDGGLPQHPRPPFNYLATFHLGGLTNELAEPALFLRDGKPTLVPPLVNTTSKRSQADRRVSRTRSASSGTAPKCSESRPHSAR